MRRDFTNQGSGSTRCCRIVRVLPFSLTAPEYCVVATLPCSAGIGSRKVAGEDPASCNFNKLATVPWDGECELVSARFGEIEFMIRGIGFLLLRLGRFLD